MINRRALLVHGSAFAASAPAIPVAPPSVLSFDVMRDGTRVGTHRIDFQRNGNDLTAIIAVEIVVRLGPIALFRYNHSAREIWRDGQFHELTSETNDDGKRFRTRVTRDTEKVTVEVPSRRPLILAADTVPLTHWNITCMRRPLVNPQDGVLITSRVVAGGQDMAELANGNKISARHYSLVGEVALEDWYDSTPIWTALRTRARDGSLVEYRRTA